MFHGIWIKLLMPFTTSDVASKGSDPSVCAFTVYAAGRGASRNSAHDSEGEGKRGLGMVVHRVNYTISAAPCVGFRGRFPWP